MASVKRPLIAGNWKLNGTSQSLRELEAIAAQASAIRPEVDVVICPPASLIFRATTTVLPYTIAIGAQDCSAEVEGPFTGDISAAMLIDAGAKYVILGHSERRQGRQETCTVVRRKTQLAWLENLTTIVCVGESEEEMLSGSTEDVLAAQIKDSLPATDFRSDKLVIAYEPVWAIGTGRIPSVERIGKIHSHIRSELARVGGHAVTDVRLLYGGSVKPMNATEIALIPNVDGVLVGGASLKATDFIAIASGFAQRRV